MLNAEPTIEPDIAPDAEPAFVEAIEIARRQQARTSGSPKATTPTT
jgi:hypothetical protein